MSTAIPPIVLVFSASDPTGGAGMQADIMTLSSMGCHALSVITAITAQDTAGVEDILAMEPEWVIDQARLVLEDMQVAAFKIGLLGSVENIAAIAEIVSDYPQIPLILDPVLASGRGDDMATEDMISARAAGPPQWQAAPPMTAFMSMRATARRVLPWRASCPSS